LRILLSRSSDHGIIDRNKKRLLMKVFSFAQRTVRQVMVPSVEVRYLDVRQSLEENLELARRQKHTRFPLCEGALDRVLGLIHVKDLFWNYEMLGPDLDLKMLKRQTLFVPENKGIDSLLAEFRKSRIHMAIVVDEFGSVVGIVTLEDILEELVGEIQDEFDPEAPPLMIRQSEEGTYLVNGRALVEEVEEALDLRLGDAENDTMAGHVMMVLGSTASIGDEVELGNKFHVRVVGIKGHQITDLLFTPLAGEDQEESGA
jgi:CBS domain containing-hemolysin-like protein